MLAWGAREGVPVLRGGDAPRGPPPEPNELSAGSEAWLRSMGMPSCCVGRLGVQSAQRLQVPRLRQGAAGAQSLDSAAGTAAQPT